MKLIEWSRSIVVGLSLTLVLGACNSTYKFEGDRPDPKLSQENQDIKMRASIRLQLAREYFLQGQHKLALEEVRNATSISSDMHEAYALRGLILMDLKEVDRAQENLLHAIKLDPKNSDYVHNYAWFLCQNNREKESIPYFEQVLKDRMYATPVKALINTAVCHLKLKDEAGAERYFLQAFNIQPNNPSVNVNLAKIFHDKGNNSKAKFYIDRVLKEEIFAADVLWLAIKIERKLQDQVAVLSLSTQLRRRYPDSKEYALFQKGAFNE